MFRQKLILVTACASLFFAACRTSFEMPPLFWILTEPEKQYYFGMLSIDSAAARRYLNLEYPAERTQMLEVYWRGREAEWMEFRSRVGYAEKTFGKHGIVNDDRARLYIRYGPPSERTVVESKRKRISLTAILEARPVEVWIYRNSSREFDLVKSAGGNFKVVAASRTGDSVAVAWLEAVPDSMARGRQSTPVITAFDVSIGRFRQKKGLTRLEIYIGVDLPDTSGVVLDRDVKIVDQSGQVVDRDTAVVLPRGAPAGYFVDEVNFLVQPRRYKIEVAIRARPDGERMVKNFEVDLLEYAQDLKLVSDLVQASIIDDGFTADKFVKPAKPRLIPCPSRGTPVGRPFYFYHEVYSLAINAEGNHRIKTSYRIFEKTTRQEQIVDYVEKVEEDVSATGYIAAKWRPMNFPAGRYVVVAETHDLIVDRKVQTILEFELKK